MKQHLIHWLGWKVCDVLGWCDRHLSISWHIWSDRVLCWMIDKNACCKKHGYKG